MGDPIEENTRQESLDRIKYEVSAMLDYTGNNVPLVDFKVYDVDTNDIHQFLGKIAYDQDLPQKLLKIGNVGVSNVDIYDMLCDYCQIYDAPLTPQMKQRIYFIETGDTAITVIPIQLFNNQVNVNIGLLEDSPRFIKDMYKNFGKLEMKDIKFTKFKNYK